MYLADSPGGLVITLEHYERWSLSSIPTVVRFELQKCCEK